MNWSQFSEDEVMEETGFPEEVLNYLWFKYLSSQNKFSPKDFYNCYVYINLYPRYKSSHRFFKHGENYITKLLSLIKIFVPLLNEIIWERRLCVFNHTSYFSQFVTGIVDTFPVEILKPEDHEKASATYNGKYETNVYKFQVVVDFLGRIIYFSGPHLGSKYDGHIWRDTYEDHPLCKWEWILGDCHYSGEEHIITRYRSPTRNLTEQFFNEVMEYHRSRVEHTNSLFSRHAMFNSIFRGNTETIFYCAHLIAQTTAVFTSMYIRYQPFGPWSHY